MQKVSSPVINSISASQIQRSGAAFGDVLTFDGSTQTWKPGSNGGGTGTTVFAQNAGLSAIDLALPAGTWVVQAWFCSFQATHPLTRLLIDDSVVVSLPDYGDPAGATFVPLVGMSQLAGGRTITCIASGWTTGAFNINSARFCVRADKQL